MMEPRSLAIAPDNWLTDSRVYNLIWLGRWLERAEGISRAVNAAARSVETGSAKGSSLGENLLPVANTLGITVGEKETLAEEIILNNQTSSVLHCLSGARLNATQVAPVELIRAISDAIMALEQMDADSLKSADMVASVTDSIADHIAQIYEEIEHRWFGSESLTEEEVFHRFVQQ